MKAPAVIEWPRWRIDIQGAADALLVARFVRQPSAQHALIWVQAWLGSQAFKCRYTVTRDYDKVKDPGLLKK